MADAPGQQHGALPLEAAGIARLCSTDRRMDVPGSTGVRPSGAGDRENGVRMLTPSRPRAQTACKTLGGRALRPSVAATLCHLFNDSQADLIGPMTQAPAPSDPSYPLSELCVLVDLPPRTVRYYVQLGLVDRPQGETRAARYGARHLEQLLTIKKWTAAGIALERIRALLQGSRRRYRRDPGAWGQ